MVYLLEACQSCGCVLDPGVLNAVNPRCPKCDSNRLRSIGVVEEQDLMDLKEDIKEMLKEKKLG